MIIMDEANTIQQSNFALNFYIVQTLFRSNFPDMKSDIHIVTMFKTVNIQTNVNIYGFHCKKWKYFYDSSSNNSDLNSRQTLFKLLFEYLLHSLRYSVVFFSLQQEQNIKFAMNDSFHSLSN